MFIQFSSVTVIVARCNSAVSSSNEDDDDAIIHLNSVQVLFSFSDVSVVTSTIFWKLSDFHTPT